MFWIILVSLFLAIFLICSLCIYTSDEKEEEVDDKPWEHGQYQRPGPDPSSECCCHCKKCSAKK